MEWTSVDSCMATSRQGPNPHHVEGIQTSYGSNPLVLHLFIQAVYNNMSGSAFRRNNMARLHVFPGEEGEMLFNLINNSPEIDRDIKKKSPMKSGLGGSEMKI